MTEKYKIITIGEKSINEASDENEKVEIRTFQKLKRILGNTSSILYFKPNEPMDIFLPFEISFKIKDSKCNFSEICHFTSPPTLNVDVEPTFKLSNENAEVFNIPKYIFETSIFSFLVSNFI